MVDAQFGHQVLLIHQVSHIRHVDCMEFHSVMQHNVPDFWHDHTLLKVTLQIEQKAVSNEIPESDNVRAVPKVCTVSPKRTNTVLLFDIYSICRGQNSIHKPSCIPLTNPTDPTEVGEKDVMLQRGQGFLKCLGALEMIDCNPQALQIGGFGGQ